MLMVFGVNVLIMMLNPSGFFRDIIVCKNNGIGILASAKTNQNSSSNVNSSITRKNTFAIPTGDPMTLLVNRTPIPLNQLNLTVTQFTLTVYQELKPIGGIGDIRQQHLGEFEEFKVIR